MSNSVSNILSQLDTLNKESGINVYIPSLKKEIKFKNLNLKQQKELLKSSVDETLTKLAFITTFYKIIEENILNAVNVSTLFTFDRNVIALALRAHGLSDQYKTDNGQVDIKSLLSSSATIDIPDSTLSRTVNADCGIKVELKAAQLGIDREISATAISKLKSAPERDIKNLVGELFVHEIIKFIQSVTFTSDGVEQTVIFADLKIDDKIAIVEKLPSTITSEILEFIKNYRDLENKFTTVDGISVEIDGSFFSV